VFPPLPHPMRQIASHNASHRFSFDLFINPVAASSYPINTCATRSVVTHFHYFVLSYLRQKRAVASSISKQSRQHGCESWNVGDQQHSY
jgi:hypothetical protein